MVEIEANCFLHQFANGIRLVHKIVPHTQVSHCGFVLDIGSRDERVSQQGLAHFWEHMAFKGTAKRHAFHVINRLESVGGELNAQTSKEKIAFYASFLHKHYEKALELLCDITFAPTFPEKQIERERRVILEEMAMYLDSPEEAIQDHFEQVLFREHPLGHNILGTREGIRHYQQADFKQFIQDNLDTSRIIFTSVGAMPAEKVLRLGEKYLAPIAPQKARQNRLPFEAYQPQHIEQTQASNQAYCAIGRPAYAIDSPQRLVFDLVCNLLGGPGMNSRLNLALRERRGYVYSAEASYNAFTDSGMFAVFFATEPKYLNRSLKVISQEFKKLREQALGKVQLQQSKEQLMGQIAMAEESNLSFMLMMANSLLDLGHIESLESIFEGIRQISAEDIMAVAQEMLNEATLSRLLYLPEKD